MKKPLAALTDPMQGSPYGPSQVPTSYFNSVGCVLAKLREADAKASDLIALAVDIANVGGNGPSGPTPF